MYNNVGVIFVVDVFVSVSLGSVKSKSRQVHVCVIKQKKKKKPGRFEHGVISETKSLV